MKRFAISVIALAVAGSAFAGQHEPRPIRIECSASRSPMMFDVERAIEWSDYSVSPPARRDILARARAACAARPTAVLTFAPHVKEDNAQLAEK